LKLLKLRQFLRIIKLQISIWLFYRFAQIVSHYCNSVNFPRLNYFFHSNDCIYLFATAHFLHLRVLILLTCCTSFRKLGFHAHCTACVLCTIEESAFGSVRKAGPDRNCTTLSPTDALILMHKYLIPTKDTFVGVGFCQNLL
jgi:hypothetical protein